MASESPSTHEASFPTAGYRAPQTSGEYFCLPEWASLPEIVAENQTLLTESNQQFFGLDLKRLRSSARQECLQAALQHTRGYTDVAEPIPDAPLIVTGHQPALVHPGVWLKNFATSQLASSLKGTALNLVIDSDLCPAPSLRVPTGTIDQPRIERVAWDQLSTQIPYEERTIQDKSLWQSFPERVSRTLAPLVEQPLVDSFWPSLAGSIGPTNVGAIISQARHLTELDWGSPILDLPLSEVCRTDTFRVFFCSLIQHLSEFTAAYNGALADYRRAHRLRNHAQPLPDLESEKAWHECPFWIWSKENPQRRPLYARPQLDRLEITDRQGWKQSLPLANQGNYASAIDRLNDWEAAGVKIRSRALTTTLFARWFLADSFIHGIGGGKYDQVTDEIARRVTQTEAPHYAVLSGTLHLPIEHPAISTEAIRAKKQRLRDFRFHGETLIDSQELSPEDQAKYAQARQAKELAIARPEQFDTASLRHQQIEKANDTFQQLLKTKRKQSEQNVRELLVRQRANQTLDSREYAFCLFPREVLQKFLLDFQPSIS